jgi:hypothetical protein
MKQLTIFAFSLLAFFACDLKTVTDAISSSDQLSEGEVARGLKEALTKGISKGAAELATENGYLESPYKILLPEEAQNIVQKLKVIPGFSDFEQEMITRINRAAEDAATEAKPIFVSAIQKMTIQDAWNILRGEENAATSYLERTTYDDLYAAFQPKIETSLNKVNAVDYWETAINKYNSLPFVKKMNPRLDDYVANKALEGLFAKVAEEEANIRKNPVARTTELLKKVFGRK